MKRKQVAVCKTVRPNCLFLHQNLLSLTSGGFLLLAVSPLTDNSQFSSSGLHLSLHRWPILAANSNCYQTKGSLCHYLFLPLHLSIPHLCLSLPPFPSLLTSFTPLLPLVPFSCRFILLLSSSSTLSPARPPNFIFDSPTVVMRCFIICISQLLIEREFRLSLGSSLRELPWETSGLGA